jgi:hypothetical protein
MPRGVPKNGFRMTKRRRQSLGKSATVALTLNKSAESVEQIQEKLTERFNALEVLSEATGKGINRSLIVSGPAGLGKSYTVEQKMRQLENAGHVVSYIKGYVRPLALYRLLYNARFEHCVLVFDDSDSIFADDVSMNLLKSACDSTEKRKLHWLSRSVESLEDEDGEPVPDNFIFEGSVIFITNYDFDDLIARGSRLAPHFEALVSRSHYLDLAMKTKLDYVVRIKQVVGQGMLRDKQISDYDAGILVDFVEKNMDNLRELSLRMVIKLATLMKMDYVNWQKLAKQTCFRAR